MVELLLAAGADTEAQTRNGETAMTWARKFGHDDVMRMLATAND